MKRKRLANTLARKVFAGKITLDDAWRVLGVDLTQKSAVPSLTKAESAPAAPPPAAPQAAPVARYPGDPEYIRAAFGPIPRPVVTSAAIPAPRETPQQVLKSMRLDDPARHWVGTGLALLQASSDPSVREAVRAALARKLDGRP
jgi:hypothetical protein